MISFSEALKIILNNGHILKSERIDINDSLNRIIAEDIYSDINMPPFNKSAMDGYACKSSDIKNALDMIETIPAGKVPEKIVGTNQCSKIMTGAIIPDGADCVIKVEDTTIDDSNKVHFTKEHTDKNICYLGEDIKEGDKLITSHSKIKPQHIAVLSSVGATKPLVVKFPKVGLICTGSELVEPHIKPDVSQIRNSNANQLIAQIKNAGALPNYYGIVEDTKEAIFETINKVTLENDVILITGGISMGDYDYVPEILLKSGFNILFDSIAIQPGKPTKFAVKGKTLCIGLPGNPVSCFVQFEFLVKPLLKLMMGEDYKLPVSKYTLGCDFIRRKVEREALIPVKILNENTVVTADYHGSAHINSLLDVYGFISVAIGVSKINKGEIVDVRQI